MRLSLFLLIAAPFARGLYAGETAVPWSGHTGEVGAAVYLKDGARAVSASDDGTLRLWNTETGLSAEAWKGHQAEAGTLRASSDGAFVASGGEDRSLRVWDTASGRQLSVSTHPGQVRFLDLAGDDKTAAVVYYDGEVTLWNVRTQSLIRTLDAGEKSHAMHVSISQDGLRVLTGQWDGDVWLWDALTGKRLAVWPGHKKPVLITVFSPDGRRALSGGRDAAVRLWDVSSGKILKILRGHDSDVHALAVSPDGTLAASGGADYTVRLWDLTSGKELAVYKGHQGDVRSLAFSPDGKHVLSASDDYTLRRWNASARSIVEGNTPTAQNPDAPSDAAQLGRLLFFDRRLSGDSTVSCAVCHDPENAFSDGRALSIGYPDTLYFRNTPSLLNSADRKHLYWDGRFSGDDMESLIRDHISEAHFMNADGRLIVEKIKQAPDYVFAFKRVFGREPAYGLILTSLKSFVHSLRSRPPPTLSEAAERGKALFYGKADCAACHSGERFTDDRFHARGVPENPDILSEPLRRISFRRFFKLAGLEDYADLKEDAGLYSVTKQTGDFKKFRTPSLINVAQTGPYMHNGVFKTLEETVRFEKPGLSDSELKDITAFLGSLSGPVPVIRRPGLPPYRTTPYARAPEKNPAAAKSGGRSEAPRSPSPLAPLPPPPVPEDNPLTPAKIELGKHLFFELSLSGNGETYCASCHEPSMGWGDGSPLSQGYEGTLHWRNSQTVLNAAYFPRLNWDGSKNSLEEQARSAIESNLSANGDPAMIEERLAQNPRYAAMFQEAFGVSRPHYEGVLKALASFMRAVPISGKSPLDRYLLGDETALSSAQIRGMKLFEGKAGCIRCHNGPLASDLAFHATGVETHPDFSSTALRQVALRFKHIESGVPEEVYRNARSDPGLFLSTLRDADRGKFRTSGLRDLKYTAPYMHNGLFNDLDSVLEFYMRGGGATPNKSPLLKPFELTPREKKDLIAFLNSMTGEPVLLAHPRTPIPDTSKGYR
jgi:cytochrome c peroxidase